MKAVVVSEPGKIEIQQVTPPEPGPYQALVHNELGCICNATDRKVIDGHFPGVNQFPLVLGHENVGIVEAVGGKVRNFKPGDRTLSGFVLEYADENMHSGWGGFGEYVVVNDHEAMVADGVADEAHGWQEFYEMQRTLPADIDPMQAIIFCTWREVLGTFVDFNLHPEQRVLVVGCGAVGLSFIKFMNLRGFKDMTAMDLSDYKLDKASAFGAANVLNAGQTPMSALNDPAHPKYDVIIDAVGSDAIINDALPLMKMGGSMCVYGVLSAPTVDLRYREGPFNFNLLFHQWPTRKHERAATDPLCDWIRNGQLNSKDFITHIFAMEEAAQAFEALREEEVIKAVLTF